MGKHAILSASSAHRWMHCTPSARMEEPIPDTTSEYAAEGSLAHEIAELKLRKKFLEPMGPRAFSARMNKLKKHELYQEEMQGYTDEYLDFITERSMQYEAAPHIAVEKTVDFSPYVPQGFGTADCILLGGNTLEIIDFKYGKGVPVKAEENPQMKLYALGALHLYSALYDIHTIQTHIVQPRLGNVGSWEYTRDGLLDWGVFQVKPAAQAAFQGEGQCNPGDWCRFCRAGAICRARCDANTALEDFKFALPSTLSNEDLGDVLGRIDPLQRWAETVKKYAMDRLLDGEPIPGWKLVEGRKVRCIDDFDAAFDVLTTAGVERALLYEQKPLPLTRLEETIGKKQFQELVGGHIIIQPGKPTLALVSDPREAYQSNRAENDFKEITEE